MFFSLSILRSTADSRDLRWAHSVGTLSILMGLLSNLTRKKTFAVRS